MSNEFEQLKLAEDEAEAAMVYSRTLLSRVAICLKLATMHRIDNAAMAPAIGALAEIVDEGCDEQGRLALQMVGENFFLNREIIKLDFSSFEAGITFRQLMLRLGAQEITFNSPPGVSGIREFLTAFQGAVGSSNPEGLLGQAFPQIGLRAISKSEEDQLRPGGDERKTLLRAYAQLALTIDAQIVLLKARKPARLAKIRRGIHTLADASQGHESLLLSITRFESFAGEVRFHLAATTALTMLMCRRLGLSRVALSEACMAGALHDMALDELPSPSLQPSPAEVATETETLRRVPLRTILRLCDGALSGDALERLAVAYEHGLNVSPKEPAGYARLVSVPCVFERLTRPRPPRRAVLPDHALRLIVNSAGTRFDPRIVKLFASVVGLYPVGTTVQLNTGEIAIVMEVPGEPAQYARPRVKVVRTAQGQPTDMLVDLAGPGERRAIAHSVDPVEAQVNVPQFLLA